MSSSVPPTEPSSPSSAPSPAGSTSTQAGKKWSDRIGENLVWAALTLTVVVITGAVAGQTWLNGYIEERLKLSDTVKLQVESAAKKLIGPPGPAGPKGDPGEITGLPSGAVVAFDLNECPKGWTTFGAATSRMIVGAGSQFDGSSSLDQAGKALKQYSFRTSGGLGELILAPENLPNAPVEGDVQHLNIAESGNKNRIVLAEDKYRDSRHQIGLIGGKGAAINAVPPFIALNYCKKS